MTRMALAPCGLDAANHLLLQTAAACQNSPLCGAGAPLRQVGLLSAAAQAASPNPGMKSHQAAGLFNSTGFGESNRPYGHRRWSSASRTLSGGGGGRAQTKRSADGRSHTLGVPSWRCRLSQHRWKLQQAAAGRPAAGAPPGSASWLRHLAAQGKGLDAVVATAAQQQQQPAAAASSTVCRRLRHRPHLLGMVRSARAAVNWVQQHWLRQAQQQECCLPSWGHVRRRQQRQQHHRRQPLARRSESSRWELTDIVQRLCRSSAAAARHFF